MRGIQILTDLDRNDLVEFVSSDERPLQIKTGMTWWNLSAVVRGIQTLTDLDINDLVELGLRITSK